MENLTLSALAKGIDALEARRNVVYSHLVETMDEISVIQARGETIPAYLTATRDNYRTWLGDLKMVADVLSAEIIGRGGTR